MNLEIDWNLVIKYLNANCSGKEKEELEAWANKSPQHRQFLDEIEYIWSVDPQNEVHIDAEAVWKEFRDRVVVDEQPETHESTPVTPLPSVQPSRHQGSTISVLYKVAAVLVLGLMLSLGYSAIQQEQKPVEQAEIVMQTVQTGRGEKASVTFSDGSKIMLNAASSVDFPQKFGPDKRVVRLNGEAYFQVARNEELPFIVVTDHARVEVLGTKFNVRDWKEDGKASVVVREGKVSVQASDTSRNRDKVVLEKGQQSVLREDYSDIVVNEIDSRNFLLWLDGGLYFDNESFRDVLRNLERRYSVSFKVDDKELLDVPYTGKFQNAELNKVLDVLSVSMDIEFNRNGENIMVKKDSDDTHE